jgi:transposase
VTEVLAAGGEVWVGDETTLRAFPPLRAGWARRGQQATVVSSGRNARRVIVGALNSVTGKLVRAVREHGRGAAVAAGLQALGEPTPGVPRLLVWDNDPPHQARAATTAAAEQEIELLRLPVRAPELNPLEDRWRSLKGVVAANRAYEAMDELAERALGYLDSLSPDDVRRRCGLTSSKFDWLPT